MLNIRVEQTTAPKAKPADETKLGFGQIFTDHMAVVDWSSDEGWHDARIVPFGYLTLHPASTCLHYGSEIFEGLKAYRRADGGIQLFRPEMNARRMMNSAERLCLPQLPEEDFLQMVTELVRLEADWVPHSEGTSLYIRPFMFGNDETLGVTHSYRSEADNLAVMQLQGYAYIDDASFDGSTAQLYLVLKRESNGARAVALTAMKSGVSGVDHADAQCANASACDFEIFLSTASLPDDIYSLGMVIQYKVGGADKFEYVEFPETCTFTVLNRQFLGDVALTD